MAYQMPFDQFQPQYPSENSKYFDDPAMMNSRDRSFSTDMRLEQEHMHRQLLWQTPNLAASFTSAPPSWANIHADGRYGHSQYQPTKPPVKYNVPRKQLCGEVPKEVDVFCGIGVWEAPTTKNKRHQQQYRQPPPPTASNQDMFENIGKWDSNMFTPQKPARNYAPMSLNTMMPYGNRAPSLESPTTSLESSPEEKNSWTSFELLLNPKSSRSSESGSEYSSPIDPHGHWNSNLQQN